MVPVGLTPLKLAARRLGDRGVSVRRGWAADEGEGPGRNEACWLPVDAVRCSVGGAGCGPGELLCISTALLLLPVVIFGSR